MLNITLKIKTLQNQPIKYKQANSSSVHVQRVKYDRKSEIYNNTNTPVEDLMLNKKILIVEDSKINAELMSIFISSFGCDYDFAENGKIFLDMMDEKDYDLILMDCNMPILNGYEATRQYRASEKGQIHIPIIAVTANAMLGDKEKCLSSGMDDYISKPVNQNTLKEKVIMWLN